MGYVVLTEKQWHSSVHRVNADTTIEIILSHGFIVSNRTGEMIELNKIYCENNLETMARMPDGFVDLVVTSPPYNLAIDYDGYNDEMDWSEYYEMLREWLKNMHRVIADDGRICINHYFSMGGSMHRTAPLMIINQIATEIGFKHHGVAFWTDSTISKKTAWGSWISASAPYVNSPYEGILILYKNRWKKDSSGVSTISKGEFMESCFGIWNIGTHGVDWHPATFPIKLAKRCINLLSYENDLVYDPFMGSGTTAIAAHESKRNWIGSEISQAYVDLANKRLKPYLTQERLEL